MLKRARGEYIIAHKAKAKTDRRHKGYYTILNESIHQEDVTVINICIH